jgi:uncharacterized damage-inducible protein DinB
MQRIDSLARVLEGWDGYQTSLARAVAPLTPAQLGWRASPGRRSLGEVVRHISLGRINWFARMRAPGVELACERVPRWYIDGDSNRHAVEDAVPADDASLLLEWLNVSWGPIRRVLDEWSVDDLTVSYAHRFAGADYLISRQWTIWRIMAHDIHHGGQVAMMLGTQGIEAVELRAWGGHIVDPPRAPTAGSR